MSTTEPSPDSFAARVSLALRKELPKRATRNWAEILLALFIVASIVLAIAAGQRTHLTYVLIHDVAKDTPISADDLVTARLRRLDGVLGSGDEVENLVAADDLMRWSALRPKDVLRLQAVTTAALHRGDALSPANVAFQMTPYVAEAVVKREDLGGVAGVTIPVGTIVRRRMLEKDESIIGTAARDLAPFVLLQKVDVEFRAKVSMPAVLVRPVAKGGLVRQTDVLPLPAHGSQVVGAFRVVCGPLRPVAGSGVLLVRSGKEAGEPIEATLLALQTSGDVSTAVVAITRDGALKLGKEDAEPIHLLQSIRGAP